MSEVPQQIVQCAEILHIVPPLKANSQNTSLEIGL